MVFHVNMGARHHMDVIAIGENQHLGQLRIADQGIDRVTDCNAQAAIGDPRQQVGAGRMPCGQTGQ
ncbi:hypothetical protein D3C85_1631450 [compost metagenome]